MILNGCFAVVIVDWTGAVVTGSGVAVEPSVVPIKNCKNEVVIHYFDGRIIAPKCRISCG